MDINNTYKNIVLVTGGAGFIGSHICEALVKNQDTLVIVLDNLSTGTTSNITNLLSLQNFVFVLGSICSMATLDNIYDMYPITHISHQGALGSVPRSIINPQDTFDNNVIGFNTILEFARKNRIKRVVYASSSSVYGDNNDDEKKEYSIGKQLSPYAASKRTNEIYGGIYWTIYGIQTIGLRYFNVFGPRQSIEGPYAAVIPKFINCIINGEAPTIYGTGDNIRDYTFVKNVVQANILALFTCNPETFGNIYNVGGGEGLDLKSLVASINNHLGKNQGVIFESPRRGDILNSKASIQKISNDLGYSPPVNFQGGLAITIKWALDNKL